MEGLLPMKQGEAQEAKKTSDRHAIELCNFIKNAFVINGPVEMITTDKPIVAKMFFRCYDSKRGTFAVAFGKEGDLNGR